MKNLDMVKVRLVPDYKLRSEVPLESSADAVQLLKEELSLLDREALCVLNLNAKVKPINASIVSVGDLNSTSVHPRELFKCAVLSSAAGIILMHNHPSGDSTPSNDDIQVTSRLIAAGRILGIRIIDHIIIGPENQHYSMADKGLIKEMEESTIEGLNTDKSLPVIELVGEQDNTPGGFEIKRSINGMERNIPLTKEEVCNIYFEQQRDFDREYVLDYLEDVKADSEKTRFFRMLYGRTIDSVLSSQAMIQRLTAELRRQKNKIGYNDFEYMEMALSRELCNIPPKKGRKRKAQER